jgi:CBS-domain-containing membrane protein
MIEAVSEATWQVTFPVLNDAGALAGLVPSQALHVVASEEGMADWIVASDVMQNTVSARLDEPAADALSRMVAAGLRQIPVLDSGAKIVAYLDESTVARRVGDLRTRGAVEECPTWDSGANVALLR